MNNNIETMLNLINEAIIANDRNKFACRYNSKQVYTLLVKIKKEVEKGKLNDWVKNPSDVF